MLPIHAHRYVGLRQSEEAAFLASDIYASIGTLRARRQIDDGSDRRSLQHAPPHSASVTDSMHVYASMSLLVTLCFLVNFT